MSYSIRQNPSPMHWDGRYGRTINKIVIHHAATTDFDGIGRTFQGTKQVSAHYGVGQNNNVDQYVSEDNAAWHAGDGEVNLQSIGIENVNLTGAPEWAIADSTFATLVELVRDIATRHNLLPLKVGENLFGHKDIVSTSCPGQLYGRLQELADAVNNGTSPTPQPQPGPDQVLNIGDKFQFQRKYRVDGIAFVNGTWQIQTNDLCPRGFNWDDNGVPAGPVTETAGGAGNPNDQILQVGSLYEIPGTFTVLNLGLNDGMWLAQIDMDGYKLWVDVATVTEV